MNPLIRSSFSLLRIVRLLTAVFVTVVSAHAQTLTKMHTFEGHGDGLNPLGGVIQDQFGNLYGTTAQGGTGTQGTVFKVDKIDIVVTRCSIVSWPAPMAWNPKQVS